MDEKLKKLAYHYGFTSQADMLCEVAQRHTLSWSRSLQMYL